MELRVVAQQYGRHGGTFDPVEAARGVHIGRVVVGEEAVAVEPAGGNQDEYAEPRVAEGEPCRAALSKHPDHQVDPLYVAAVDAAQLLGPGRVVGERLEV